ncbi:MAG: 23S rRNA (pseudouridine(1915)-N(3))-methyltransferase RlmH [Firmicutes bacterium]|nr:23S rRNA (pseudouridine(1915)-N(3))-methyltransferase RlmH [Bacillota bacterium]
MHFRILAVGKVKSIYLQQEIKHYQGRLRPYARVEIIEVAEGKASRKQEKEALKLLLMEEGQKLLRQASLGKYNLALDEKGKNFSSLQLASTLARLEREGHMPLNFFIGGAKGLDRTVLQASDLTLSLSRLTFPHQLTRLILLEQLYRCCKIIKNEPYHY